MYSDIRPRAGLVALVFALISISLVSAVPIPIPTSQPALSSTLSFPSLNGENHIQPDTRKIKKFSMNGQMSRAPAVTRAFTGKQTSIDTDGDELVRRNVFSKIKKGFQNLGHEIKHVAEKVGSGIKKAAEKVGTGIKTAAKKVENFAKTTGATVAKFGLKVAQSVGTAIGTVASFIPDVGKPLQQAINGVSKVAGVASDSIHAKLSKKLQKGVNVMNTANKIMSIARRDLSDEVFQQRDDISDAYHFAELDDATLESYFDDDYEH